MWEWDYRFDGSKTETIFNGPVIVLAKLIAIVHQLEKGHWKENHYLQILLGMISQMHYH